MPAEVSDSSALDFGSLRPLDLCCILFTMANIFLRLRSKFGKMFDEIREERLVSGVLKFEPGSHVNLSIPQTTTSAFTKHKKITTSSSWSCNHLAPINEAALLPCSGSGRLILFLHVK